METMAPAVGAHASVTVLLSRAVLAPQKGFEYARAACDAGAVARSARRTRAIAT